MRTGRDGISMGGNDVPLAGATPPPLIIIRTKWRRHYVNLPLWRAARERVNYAPADVQVIALPSDAKCCKGGEWRAQSSGASGLRGKRSSPDGVDRVGGKVSKTCE